MIIVGAGMAGLLAGLMLRRHSPTILESQSSLPNNHAALLRFRTPAVSEATGIPFTKVTVRKAIYRTKGGLADTASMADANEYARKVTGAVTDRSILDLSAGTRYIAPEDFIAQMSRGLNIKYNTPFTMETGSVILSLTEHYPAISTMPMPKLMEMAEWPDRPDFHWRPIWTSTGWVEEPVTRVYQTLYYPDRTVPWYRASLTGNRLTVEYMSEPTDTHIRLFQLSQVLSHFGVIAAKVRDGGLSRQEYGKLADLKDQDARKGFIMAMTDQYNIWSLGRFATWRQIVLDDVVKDIQFIDRVLSARDTYARRLHHHNS